MILCTNHVRASISAESRAIEKGGADGALTPNPPLITTAWPRRQYD